MKKNSLNNYLATGLLLYGLVSILNRTIGLPEFINGLGMGTAICLELIGFYAMKHDMAKFRNFKKNLVRKVIGQ